MHDYSIYKQDKTKYIIKTKRKLADKAYCQKNNQITTPFKKPRKSKHNSNPKLTKEQKKFNKEQNKERVEIEHSFAYLKKFKILSERYRNARRRFRLRFTLICCFFNLDLEVV